MNGLTPCVCPRHELLEAAGAILHSEGLSCQQSIKREGDHLEYVLSARQHAVQ